MMNPISKDQAQTLATLIASLRTDWDAPGIYAALGKAKALGTAMETSLAALRAAADPKNRTPAIIALPGPHWTTPGATPTVGAGKEPRCEVYGHEHQAARTCVHCRTEALSTGVWPNGSQHQERPTHRDEPEPYEDAKTRAAGDHRG